MRSLPELLGCRQPLPPVAQQHRLQVGRDQVGPRLRQKPLHIGDGDAGAPLGQQLYVVRGRAVKPE